MSLSPLADTFGVRIDKLLHTGDDYHKYHGYLNLKLQKLRRRLQLTTKDTKKYSSKEKYSRLDKVSYNNDKHIGLLVLLHAERDLAFVEMQKLNARERGRWKKSEKKLSATRLKRACKTVSKLLRLSEDESSWLLRAELLIFSKLVKVEHLLNGKQSKSVNSELISKELAFVLSSLDYLRAENCLSDEIVNHITFRYEHFLRQSSNKYSSKELREFILQQVESNGSDELILLLKKQGYNVDESGESEDVVSVPTAVNWRRFVAEIHSAKVGQLLQEAQSYDGKVLNTLKKVLRYLESSEDIKNGCNSSSEVDKDYTSTRYSRKEEAFNTNISKWNEVVQAQETFMANAQETDARDGEDDQILLTYLKFNYIFALITRELFIFSHTGGNTGFERMAKFEGLGCEKLKAVVGRLVAYLQEIMELPGVYSDDELMFQLEVAKTCYQTYLANAIASLYRLRMDYTESLAIYNHCMETIKSAKDAIGDTDLGIVPHIINRRRLDALEYLVTKHWEQVGEIVAHAKCIERLPRKNDMSLVEILDSKRPFGPWDISVETLFPLRPQIKPISAKPTLFDLAFNYIRYDDTPDLSDKETEHAAIGKPEPAKKRGIFGLFGR